MSIMEYRGGETPTAQLDLCPRRVATNLAERLAQSSIAGGRILVAKFFSRGLQAFASETISRTNIGNERTFARVATPRRRSP